MQLQPNSNYPLVYQIFPDDPATYYIQAVVRLSNSGKVWQTVNLSNSGNNRYVGQYLTPGEDTNGVPIDITYYVYTDAGHTTLSQQYDTKNVDHLVFTLASPTIGFSGGGGDNFSLKDMAEVMKQVLEGKSPQRILPEDKFNVKELEPYFQTFHDSLIGIYDKNDILEKGINKIKGSQGRNKKRLLEDKKEMSNFISSLLENTKKELASYVEDLISQSNNHFADSFNGSQRFLTDKVSEVKSEISKQLKELEKISKGVDEKINKHNYHKIQVIRDRMAKILEDEEGNYKEEDNFLKKANKLLGL